MTKEKVTATISGQITGALKVGGIIISSMDLACTSAQNQQISSLASGRWVNA